MADNINEELLDDEALKITIKGGVKRICESDGRFFPNICRYASRSTIDESDIVDMVFKHMTAQVMPLNIEAALGQVEGDLDHQE
jgi:hypothetical protein